MKTSKKTGKADDIKQNWIGRYRRFFMWGVPLLLAGIGGGFFYVIGGRYISTDDAYIQAARVSVSADISGRVSELPLVDNQSVHKGDVLFRLDNGPFEIAEKEAEAQLAGARLQVAAMKASYRQKLAGLKSAEDTFAYQQREYDRQKKLAESGISSQAQLDKASQMLQAAEQEMAARRQDAYTVLAGLGDNPDININDHPLVQAAQAKLDRARLNLSYTTVYAPIDGIVTKVEQLQVGDYVTKAAPLFALVSNTDVWVEANFKETDLTHMRPGQEASIEVDAYSKKKLSGKVASLSPGTGSSFSLIPPENATGNWVKIVQRLPVRIVLDDTADVPLQAGLSVTAVVDTEHRRILMGN
jgi:membrane fusion protein, multidrug efflux system